MNNKFIYNNNNTYKYNHYDLYISKQYNCDNLLNYIDDSDQILHELFSNIENDYTNLLEDLNRNTIKNKDNINNINNSDIIIKCVNLNNVINKISYKIKEYEKELLELKKDITDLKLKSCVHKYKIYNIISGPRDNNEKKSELICEICNNIIIN
tara:strand:+ start:1528 stop:1989 length:462 start_codon:yes stop_codon:yes gene_type:complete